MLRPLVRRSIVSPSITEYSSRGLEARVRGHWPNARRTRGTISSRRCLNSATIIYETKTKSVVRPLLSHCRYSSSRLGFVQHRADLRSEHESKVPKITELDSRETLPFHRRHPSVVVNGHPPSPWRVRIITSVTESGRSQRIPYGKRL